MSSSWESKRQKIIHNYKIQIALILSFCLCKQKQHTKLEKIKSQFIINKTQNEGYKLRTHAIAEPVPDVKFTYANVNGSFKTRLEKTEGKYTFSFNSIDSLHDIFRNFDWS